MGELYGMFKNENGIIKISNRIYQQLIYGYMISKLETSTEMIEYNFTY